MARIPINAPLVIVIRDGWGENPNADHESFNAVKLASTPVADRLGDEWPGTLIATSGEDVGLAAGTMGNSEVGHQNIGAGRIVEQEILRISKAIRDGTFFDNPALAGAFQHAGATGASVHLVGLVSDGRVHSDLEHLLTLVELAARHKWAADRLVVHAITDGRDTGPRTGLGFIERVEETLEHRGVGRIGSVIGRYYAMDRDHRWDRVALAWSCLTGRPVKVASAETRGIEVREASSAREALERYYQQPSEPNRSGDEFVVPTRIGAGGRIGDGDAVIFFNFRGDRPREITRAFCLDDEAWKNVTNGGFDRGARMRDLYYAAMTAYEEGLPVSAVAFRKPAKMPDILGEVVARQGLSQFRCAETEKYPHVTFFFNDYREEPFGGEHRFLVPSPREVSTYDLEPEMSAMAVTEGVLGRIGAPDGEPLVIVNYANGDMVGHTGDLAAATRAVEVVDECVGRVVEATLARGGSLIITADHGNAEQMWDPRNDCPHTAHTTYDVPLIVVGTPFKGERLRAGGRLADIAPTALAMLGLDRPAAMTGHSLLAGAGASAASP